ncbi:MAG: glucose-6-phosphate isomerase [Clostridia bacterium]|nr:glucose-6-phosphate isomerase [Clostridia bacterium]
MKKVTLAFDKAFLGISEETVLNMQAELSAAHNFLHGGCGAGGNFTGWLTLPKDYDRNELEKIEKAAAKIQSTSDALVVIGIGGSYLGAKAALEWLGGGKTEIIFAGNTLSGTALYDALESVRDRDFSVNVISKSGTTTEPAVAFRFFKALLEEKYGKEGARERIYATTDKEKGALRALAEKEGYETFVIPDNIGGRFSVLSAVGLLPIAASGVNVREIMEGAEAAYGEYLEIDMKKNPCYRYAAVRNALYRSGKKIELLANYEPCLVYFSEWWKQLFGESEGKDGKGIFPAAASFSTDLHSLGQYVQDGQRILFETVLRVEKPKKNLVIPSDAENLDGLNFIAGVDVDSVNEKAFLGTALAHYDGGVPCLTINIPELTPYYFGYMVYFFEKACGISGYLLGVNPFDQPGVEAYKKNMFALLGKPGYEEERRKLEKRL